MATIPRHDDTSRAAHGRSAVWRDQGRIRQILRRGVTLQEVAQFYRVSVADVALLTAASAPSAELARRGAPRSGPR